MGQRWQDARLHFQRRCSQLWVLQQPFVFPPKTMINCEGLSSLQGLIEALKWITFTPNHNNITRVPPSSLRRYYNASSHHHAWYGKADPAAFFKHASFITKPSSSVSTTCRGTGCSPGGLPDYLGLSRFWQVHSLHQWFFFFFFFYSNHTFFSPRGTLYTGALLFLLLVTGDRCCDPSEICFSFVWRE